MDCILGSIARGGIDVAEDCCRNFALQDRAHRALKGNLRRCLCSPPQAQCRLRPRKSLVVDEGHSVQLASNLVAYLMLLLKGLWSE